MSNVEWQTGGQTGAEPDEAVELTPSQKDLANRLTDLGYIFFSNRVRDQAYEAQTQDVIEYLNDFPAVVPILLDIPLEVNNSFPVNSLILELFHDPKELQGAQTHVHTNDESEPKLDQSTQRESRSLSIYALYESDPRATGERSERLKPWVLAFQEKYGIQDHLPEIILEYAHSIEVPQLLLNQNKL